MWKGTENGKSLSHLIEEYQHVGERKRRATATIIGITLSNYEKQKMDLTNFCIEVWWGESIEVCLTKIQVPSISHVYFHLSIHINALRSLPICRKTRLKINKLCSPSMSLLPSRSF